MDRENIRPLLIDIFLTGNETDVACNHFRAVDFYTASVEGQDFTGFACPSFDSFVKGRCFPCGNENGGVECRHPGWQLKTDKPSAESLYYLTLPNVPFAGTSWSNVDEHFLENERYLSNN